MKITLSNISFYGTENKKPRRYNYTNQIIEPVDNGDPRTNRRGNVIPTPFEDCFEKMSFEEDIEDNMWRDAQYVDEFEKVTQYSEDLTPHIIPVEPFIRKYYSEDDIPVADSVMRRTIGFNPYVDVRLDIDTDMDSSQVMVLNKINYEENIIPNLIPGADYDTINNFAKAAAAHEQIGYPPAKINRAIERCRLYNAKTTLHEPDMKLFEFLLDNPNHRSFVVQKAYNGSEIFDITCAIYFKNFRKYFANIEDVKAVLDLCKIDESGLPMVDRKLCEVIMLLRHRSAQDSKAPKVDYSMPSYNSTAEYKSKKYVNPETPLSENDIALIQKLKSSNLSTSDMYSITKAFLSDKKMTVSATLKHIDNFISRKEEINNIMFLLKDNPIDNNNSAILSIEYILDREFGESLSNPTAPLKKAMLLETTQKLMILDLNATNIEHCLKKLNEIKNKMPLNDEFVEDFINMLVEEDKNDKHVINKPLADILTKLVLMSRNLSDIDHEIMALLKENGQNNPKLLTFVNGMLNKGNKKQDILTAIKEKIAADTAAKEKFNTLIGSTEPALRITHKNADKEIIINFTPKDNSKNVVYTSINDGKITQQRISGEIRIQEPRPNETYMDKLIRERLSEDVINAIDERLEQEEARKRLENSALRSTTETNPTTTEKSNNETYIQKLIRERLGDYKPDNED